MGRGGRDEWGRGRDGGMSKRYGTHRVRSADLVRRARVGRKGGPRHSMVSSDEVVEGGSHRNHLYTHTCRWDSKSQ